MIKVISVVSNDIVTDNRVHKIALSLGANGYEVSILGRLLKSSGELYDRPYSTKRLKLLFSEGPLFYFNLNLSIFLYLLRADIDIILSNDLDTLLGCWMASRIRRMKLVFDSHELFPEVPELVNRPRVRNIWLRLEKYLVPKVEYAFTVSKPIAEYYQKEYKVDFRLIRNLGRFRYDYEFEGLEKDPAVKTVIYQGAVNIGRGLELIIRSIKHLKNTQLWIVGDGDIISKLRQLVTHLGLKDKVKLFGRVPIEELWKYTARADIGISLEEDLGLNYRYALPNKLFDYIQARIPVVTSDLPEMAAIVKQYKIGDVLEERTAVKLAETIEQLLSGKIIGKQLNANIELAARELCWEREEDKLITLFKRVSTLT